MPGYFWAIGHSQSLSWAIEGAKKTLPHIKKPGALPPSWSDRLATRAVHSGHPWPSRSSSKSEGFIVPKQTLIYRVGHPPHPPSPYTHLLWSIFHHPTKISYSLISLVHLESSRRWIKRPRGMGDWCCVTQFSRSAINQKEKRRRKKRSKLRFQARKKLTAAGRRHGHPSKNVNSGGKVPPLQLV